MNRISWLFIALCLLLPRAAEAKALSGATPADTDEATPRALALDGPYIWHDSIGPGARIVCVTADGQLSDRHVDRLEPDYTFTVSTQDGRHSFSVQLHPVMRPACSYPEASQTFVMSDPHGNFDCFQSLLRAGGIIDDHYHWQFADGHLVILGDVMDRGVDVNPIFWLIYQLEAEAQAAGGHVSFVLGNHEPLVLMSDNRYTEGKYLALADTLGMPCGMLYGPRTHLGSWLLSRNALMRIGRNLFVHAGLSPRFLERNLDLAAVNREISRGLYLRRDGRRALGDLTYFLFGNDGPIWYRGLVRDDERYHPAPADSVQLILQRYEADRLYVGHTIFPQVSPFYGGKVVGVNVDNMEARQALKPRAVLIRRGTAYLVTDQGVTSQTL